MPSRVAFSDNCRISCLGPPTANSDMEDDDGELTCRSNYSYHKLPANLLKLSILKLDGSVFDVVVEKNASVGELKHAIEDIFISSPDEDQGKISWSHVWSHFCLSFGDQKLLNDRSYILNLGIKDGDQLPFVHHLSIDYSPKKRRAKNPSGSCSSIQRLGYTLVIDQIVMLIEDRRNGITDGLVSLLLLTDLNNIYFLVALFLRKIKGWGASEENSVDEEERLVQS